MGAVMVMVMAILLLLLLLMVVVVPAVTMEVVAIMPAATCWLGRATLTLASATMK
jgi:hypothetical protein